MSNRRMGGPRGGNRGFSQPFHSGGVNPWQGGSNNMNNGGIISQLTSNPQLALALTSLLQPQQQQQPPSLLSLNTSPAFSNSRDIGRFGNRGRESRRHEPYKNRGGWRADKGRKRSPKRDNKNKKDAKPKNEENAEDGEDGEKKRDWKDEKNQADAKEEEGDEAKKAQDKVGRFVGVPPKYLNCFVCNKQMWDGQSMGKHVKGRAHLEMIKALEESIHICVNILRENMRLTEERKMIELNRQNRLKKYGDRKYFEPNSHCNMCDLKFMGKIVTHRRSEGHQRLKGYLHPTCRICEKEFPSRLEWIEHRLTPEHLRKLHEITEKSLGGKDGDEVIESAAETPAEVDDAEASGPVPAEIESEQDLDLEPLLEEPLQMESENPIFELDEPLDGLQNRIPAYKQERAVSTKSLKPFTGFVCDLCHRSFVDEQDSQDHLKSKRHYYKFVEALREQFERRERRRKEEEKAKKEAEEAASKAEEAAKENGENEAEGEEETAADQEMYDPEVHTEDNAEVKTEEAEEVNDTEMKEEEPLKEEEEEKKPEVKEVPAVEEKLEPATPAKGTPRKAAVRNGAGPKSKRTRK